MISVTANVGASPLAKCNIYEPIAYSLRNHSASNCVGGIYMTKLPPKSTVPCIYML